MRSATWWGWLAAWTAVMGVLVAGGMAFVGCAPGPEEPSGTEGQPAPGATPAAPSPAEPAGQKGQPQAGAPEPPPAPAVSTFAPAKDLEAQVQAYLEDLDEAVETEETYQDEVDNIAQDANTLILVSLALGLHDSDSQYKAAAPAMIKAAQQLAAAKDYASTKAGIAAVKEATASTGSDPAELKWGKVASLKELMVAVGPINTRMKRYVRKDRPERMKDAADDLAGYSAVLAVIAQGSMVYADETIKPAEAEKWYGFFVHMRDASAEVNRAVRAFEKDSTPAAFDVADAAMQDLAQSCDDCHEVFNPPE
jgi:hypothetical protein